LPLKIQKSLLLAQRVSSQNEYAVPDPELIDIRRVLLPVNSRYGLVVYADASFAIGGEYKQLEWCPDPMTIA
jgi:hypothetical protein